MKYSGLNNSQIEKFPRDLWGKLRGRLSEERIEKMEKVASARTESIHLIVQDVHSPHNVSACLRSAEALGVLHVHVVDSCSKFQESSVSRGVDKWLMLHRYPDIASCAKRMAEYGIQIYAGMPSHQSILLNDVPVEEGCSPVAILFGNEHDGVSPDWAPHLAGHFTIPMVGMVESMNISVCAAISLYTLTQKAQYRLSKEQYFVSVERREQILSMWVGNHFPAWQEYYNS